MDQILFPSLFWTKYEKALSTKCGKQKYFFFPKFAIVARRKKFTTYQTDITL